MTSHSQVRATRAIAATDEILITYGQHDAAELLRTYGISEGEHAQHDAAVTLDFSIDEVVDATRTSLAKTGAVLSAATATARCKEARNGRRPVSACKCSARRHCSLDRYAVRCCEVRGGCPRAFACDRSTVRSCPLIASDCL